MADNRLDAIVYRTMERSPSLIKEATTPPYRGNAGIPTLNTFLVYVPAITVPSSFTPEKLPTGLTFLGRPYSDATVISVSICLRAGNAPPRTAEHNPSTWKIVPGREPYWHCNNNHCIQSHAWL